MLCLSSPQHKHFYAAARTRRRSRRATSGARRCAMERLFGHIPRASFGAAKHGALCGDADISRRPGAYAGHRRRSRFALHSSAWRCCRCEMSFAVTAHGRPYMLSAGLGPPRSAARRNYSRRRRFHDRHYYALASALPRASRRRVR